MNDHVAKGVITKIDDDKRLVFGWASIIKDVDGRVLLDRQDDYIDDEEELEKAAYTYVLHSRDGGEMHVRKGVSTMVESVVLSKEKQAALGIPEGVVPVGWWIGFRVNDDRVWDQVKKGDYMGFSVHGTGQRQQGILKDGEFTEVEKRAISPDEEEALKEHSQHHSAKHMKAMRQRMKQGATLNEAHEAASKEVGKSDCGCGGSAKPTGTPVSKRLFTLLTKAQKAKKVKGTKKVSQVMREFERGELKSSSGKPVKSRKQAMAIALSEQRRMEKGDFPGHPFRGNQWTGGKPGQGTKSGGKKPAKDKGAPKKKPAKPERPASVASALERAKSGKKVSLKNPKEVAVFLEEFHKEVQAMKAAGKKAKNLDLCKVTVPGTNLFCGENKGIPRGDMPQIGGKTRPGTKADKLPKNKDGEVDGTDAFISHLEGKKIEVRRTKVPAAELKATQTELIGAKVAGMMLAEGFDPSERPIFVSRDGYVVDGHHRWAAVVGRDASDGKLGDRTMNVQMVDMDIMDVLKEASKWADEFGIKTASFKDG